jgi:medium-chain acyl-[acyl-carrier-protein] hydrolase
MDVCPVELPGHGRRVSEPPVRDARELAAAISSALVPFLDVPFALFGHSMGALLAFEVAQTLRRRGAAEPECLFVSGRGAPQAPVERRRLSELPDAPFVDEVKKLNGTPPELFEDAELAELVLPILRADFALCESYRYEPLGPLTCPLVAFGGIEDAGVTRTSLLAWREQTTASFTLRMMPGDHFFIRTATTAVLDEVSSRLEAAAA